MTTKKVRVQKVRSYSHCTIMKNLSIFIAVTNHKTMVQLIKKQGIRSLRLSRLNTPQSAKRWGQQINNLRITTYIPGDRPVLCNKRLYFTPFTSVEVATRDNHGVPRYSWDRYLCGHQSYWSLNINLAMWCFTYQRSLTMNLGKQLQTRPLFSSTRYSGLILKI